MSGEEGKTNDAVRGSSQPAELCHLLSGCRCSAPECPAGAPQHHAPITSFSPRPNPHLLPATLQLQGCASLAQKAGTLPWPTIRRWESTAHPAPSQQNHLPLATCRIPVGGFPAKLRSLLNFSQTQFHPGQNAPHLESSLEQVPQRRHATVTPARRVLHSECTYQHCRKHIRYKNTKKKRS